MPFSNDSLAINFLLGNGQFINFRTVVVPDNCRLVYIRRFIRIQIEYLNTPISLLQTGGDLSVKRKFHCYFMQIARGENSFLQPHSPQI